MDNVIQNQRKVFILTEQLISKLKHIASEHPLKRSRICIHEDKSALVQEMVIVAHRETIVQIHRHPIDRPESYHILEGRLLVRIFSDDGKLDEKIELSSSGGARFYRIRGGIWHQPVPITEWVVYHEVFTGPFDKSKDVLYASTGDFGWVL